MNEHFNVSEKRILPTFLLFLVLSWPLGAHRFFLRIRFRNFIYYYNWWIWHLVDHRFILIVTGSMKDDRQIVKVWVD